MKLFNKVRGSMETVPNVEVDRDTVYVRNNIIAIDTEDFKGWQYDEIQYKKDEYTEFLQEQNKILGNQIVQIDIRLIMGGM